MDAVVAATRSELDARGKPVRVEDADGEVRSFTYDGAGRLQRATLGDPTRGTPRELERDTYDAAGRLVEQVRAGVTYRFAYDAVGRHGQRLRVSLSLDPTPRASVSGEGDHWEFVA